MAKKVTLAELKKMISKLNTLKLGKENMLESLGIEKIKMAGKFDDLANAFMDAIEAIAEDEDASKKCPKIYETFFNRLVEQVDEADEDDEEEEELEDDEEEEEPEDDEEEEEPEEKPTKRRTRKKKPTTKTKTKKKTVAKTTKKKGPSNKFVIWEKWNSRKKKPTVEELLELVDNAVKESTVKKWVGRWKKGIGLPAGAE